MVPLLLNRTKGVQSDLTDKCIQQGIDEGRITNSSTNDDIDKELQKMWTKNFS